MFIYILSCDKDKYYIGKSTDYKKRFDQHNSQENNCSWTKKYKPIKIIEFMEQTDPFDEDKITKKYMMKYGIDNVRGGSYTKIDLEEWQIKSLKHEFNTVDDKCGNVGHIAKLCTQQKLEQFDTIEKINEQIREIEYKLINIFILEQIMELYNELINETKRARVNLHDKRQYDKKYMAGRSFCLIRIIYDKYIAKSIPSYLLKYKNDERMICYEALPMYIKAIKVTIYCKEIELELQKATDNTLQITLKNLLEKKLYMIDEQKD